MLFLMNDAVLDIRPEDYRPPIDSGRFEALSLTYLTKLGQEIYSEAPLLHRTDPERAKRLASLISTKAPEVNAALFAAPAVGCRPDEVAMRLANVSIEVMTNLYNQAKSGSLTAVAADREVWRRMAA